MKSRLSKSKILLITLIVFFSVSAMAKITAIGQKSKTADINVMVVSVLDGTSRSDIKMISESPNRYFFDNSLLEKFKIPMEVIPKDAILIKKNPSFMEKHKQLLLPSFMLSLFLLIIFIIIFIDNIRRRTLSKKLSLQNKSLIDLNHDLAISKEALKKSEERYKNLAYTDVLTGLDNRTALQRKISTLFINSDPVHHSGTILFLDVDHFKYINDTHGHDAGDEVLKIIGQRLKELHSEQIYIARLGGDEFVILAHNMHESDAIQQLVQKLHQLIEMKYPVGEQELCLTASIGIARYPENGTEYNELIKNVDTAMYKAKERGRDQHTFFDEQMNNKPYPAIKS